MSFGRKLKRGWSAENNKAVLYLAVKATQKSLTKVRDKAYEDATNDAFTKLLAVATEIVYNDYGKLRDKDTRIKTFVRLLLSKAGKFENPSDEQKKVEQLLFEQCGIMIKR